MDNLYKHALDDSFDGILITNERGVIVYVNKRYEEITGVSKDEILNKDLNLLLERGLFSRAISLEVMKDHRPVSTIHRYISGKSALSTAVPIFDKDRFIGVVNNTRNIEDLVALENKLKGLENISTQYFMENQSLKQLLNQMKDFICFSQSMKETIQQANRVSKFDTTVLLTGESGTGKEVIARYIHGNSKRSKEAFVRVNCAAIPKDLFESELFGYEKGSFTGALNTGKMGFFELANNGTLLLDEIGEMPLEVQSKLLRALQEKEIVRIGGNKPIKLNVRIISSTNKNLLEEVEKENFREDLYFRLNVFPIKIAPLRERKEDILPLISFFLQKLNRKYQTTKSIQREAKEALKEYHYPGNVRELENMIEYLYVVSDDFITLESIPGKILSTIMMNTFKKNHESERTLPDLINLYEKTIIEDVIRNHHTLEKASSVMGIHPSTLSRKMKKYKLRFN